MLIYAMMFVMVAPEAAAKAPQPADKVVCKRFEETGSLVKKRKVCYTRAKWQQSGDSAREEWSAVQGTMGSSRGN